MPPRVAATFGLADFVAAEDTRVTLRLLNHLGLKKPMVSYYDHALHHGASILARIEAGESCALTPASPIKYSKMPPFTEVKVLFCLTNSDCSVSVPSALKTAT